jgi:SnoaL-like protein
VQDRVELLQRVYRDFNRRNIEPLLAVLHQEVIWPNGWEGGTIVGRDGVRNYWTRQWAAINPTVEPLGFQALADGRIKVGVRQRVHNLAGELAADEMVTHTFTFDGDLISRMEITEG